MFRERSKLCAYQDRQGSRIVGNRLDRNDRLRRDLAVRFLTLRVARFGLPATEGCSATASALRLPDARRWFAMPRMSEGFVPSVVRRMILLGTTAARPSSRTEKRGDLDGHR
jgi:hypothetical protein